MSVAPAAIDRREVCGRLRGLLGMAQEAVKKLDLCRAGELYETARVLGAAVGELSMAARAVAGLGYIAQTRSEIPVALRLHRAALACMAPDDEERSLVLGWLGFAQYDAGDLDAAVASFHEAASCVSSPLVRNRLDGYLGNVARARGEFDRAARIYDAVEEKLRHAGDPRFASTFAMDRAITALLAGDVPNALARLEKLAENEVVLEYPQLDTLVHHYRSMSRTALALPDLPESETRYPLAAYLARVRAYAAGKTDDVVELRETLLDSARLLRAACVADKLHKPSFTRSHEVSGLSNDVLWSDSCCRPRMNTRTHANLMVLLLLSGCSAGTSTTNAPADASSANEAPKDRPATCKSSTDCNAWVCVCQDGETLPSPTACANDVCLQTTAESSFCKNGCRDHGGVREVRPAPHVASSPECEAWCAKGEGLKCGTLSCERYFFCGISKTECEASKRAALRCQIDEGTWACNGRQGWSVQSSCGTFSDLCDAGAP